MRIWKQQYILWHCSKPAFGRVFGNSSISFDIAANLRLDVYLETAISRYCSKPTIGQVFGNSRTSIDIAVNLHLGGYLATAMSPSMLQ